MLGVEGRGVITMSTVLRTQSMSVRPTEDIRQVKL